MIFAGFLRLTPVAVLAAGLSAPLVVAAQEPVQESRISTVLRDRTLSHRAEVDEQIRKKELLQEQAQVAELEARLAKAQAEAQLAELEARIAFEEARTGSLAKDTVITREEVLAMIQAEAEGLRRTISDLDANLRGFTSVATPSSPMSGIVTSNDPKVRWLGFVGRDAAMFDINGVVSTLKVGDSIDGVQLIGLDADSAKTRSGANEVTHRLAR